MTGLAPGHGYAAPRPRRWDPSFVVRAPRQHVFDYLADPRNRPEWQASLRSVDVLDAGQPRVGMRWVDRLHGGLRFTLEIVAMDDGVLWAERGRTGPLTAYVTLLLDDVDRPDTVEGPGTRVRIMSRFEGRGPARPLAKVATVVMALLVRVDVPRLRRILQLG